MTMLEESKAANEINEGYRGPTFPVTPALASVSIARVRSSKHPTYVITYVEEKDIARTFNELQIRIAMAVFLQRLTMWILTKGRGTEDMGSSQK